MDGTAVARFWRITLPLLMPNMLVVLVLALIRAVQIFDEVFVLTGGGPGTATTIWCNTSTRPPSPAGADSGPRGGGVVAAGGGVVAADAAATGLCGGNVGTLNHRHCGQWSVPLGAFLSATRGGRRGLDRLAELAYLVLGVLLMFGPVLVARAVVVQDAGRADSFRRPCCRRSRRVRDFWPGGRTAAVRITEGDHAAVLAAPPHRPAGAQWSIPRRRKDDRVPLADRARCGCTRPGRTTRPCIGTLRFSPLSREHGVHHGRRHGDHAAVQLPWRRSR